MSSKLKLLKILEILMETDEEHPLTANQIKEKLKTFGIVAERKSIYRDINLLIESGDYDISLCADNKQGYYMASREFEDWEIKILTDAVQSAKFLPEQSAKKLIKKLHAKAGENSRKVLGKSTTISLNNKTDNVLVKLSIEEILTAIKKNKKISFQYTQMDGNKKITLRKEGHNYIVNPYFLVWENEYYYLVGNYDKYSDLSHYRLDRIKNLVVTNEPLKELSSLLGDNSALKLQEYIKLALYHFGGEKIKLTLQIEEYMVEDIVDYFGKDVNFLKIKDGYEVRVDVLDSEGLYFWLLQYETNVKVVSPEKVRDRLLKKVESIMDMYK